MSRIAPKLSLAEATELVLRKENTSPVVTAYALGKVIFRVITDGHVDGRPLRINRREVRSTDYYDIRNNLVGRQVLAQDAGLTKGLLRFAEAQRPDPEVVICDVDPFGFVSHLSAMAHYSLTNRIPKVLFYTTLGQVEWSGAASERMRRDLGESFSEYQAASLPLLRRTKVEHIHQVTLNYVRTGQTAGAFRLANNNLIRVSTIGRTFLDMLQRPDLCGGIQHVIEIFQSQAQNYLTLIVNELDAHGTKIDRVRAGFILEDRCDIRDPRVDLWTVDAQRGGSRRLDPHGEYAPEFSERWMLSINA